MAIGGAFLPNEITPTAYVLALHSIAQRFPNATFHFNLTTESGGRLDHSIHRYGSNVTTAEYKLLSTLYRSRTTFYTKSGSIYKPITP